MSRELKKYKLRPTRKPMQSPYLASRVEVSDEVGTTGYCYISFSEEFVEAVGRKLPEGVAVFAPARIEVAFDPILSKWIIGASYQSYGLPVVLWVSDTKPTWIQRISTKGYHDSTTKNREGGTSRSTAASRAGSQGTTGRATAARP